MVVWIGLILILTVVPHIASATADAPTVSITSYQVTPTVLLPDEEGTITVTIVNTAQTSTVSESTSSTSTTGSTTSETTVDVPVLVESVFMNGRGVVVLEGNSLHVGALGPRQSMTLTFLIRAPSQVGMYFPEVWIRIPDGTSVKYPIPVNVNSPIGIQKEAIIIVESMLPDSVSPGDTIPVTLIVRNSGQLLADDVTVKIENASAMIAPKDTDLYHFGSLNAGDEKTTQVTLLSDERLSSGLIEIPLILNYKVADGTTHTDSTSINVVMKGKGELGFVSVDTSPRRVTENQPFDLTIRIENTGTGEVKQVAATVDLPMTGTKQSFIGKIKPGNDAPAVFLLDGAKEGTYTYNTTITYVDDLGTHTDIRQMSLRIDPVDSTGGYILLLIIIIGCGILAYRFWYLPKKNGSGALPWVKKS